MLVLVIVETIALALMALLVAGLSWRWRQVLPPSLEALNTTGSGVELMPRKATLHR